MRSTPAIPVSIDWEITKLCNQTCNFCYNGSGPDQSEHFTEQEAIKLVDDLSAAGVFHMVITGGEPFAYPWILKVLNHAASRHMLFTVITNGSLFSKQLVAALVPIKDNFRAIQVSIHGFSDEAYDDIGVPRRNLSLACNNIKKLVDLGFNVTVNSVLTPANASELLDLYKWCSKVGVYGFISSPIKSQGRAREDGTQFVDGEQWILFLRELFDLNESLNGPRLLISDMMLVKEAFNKRMNGKLLKYSCPAATQVFMIKSNGVTLPCPFMGEDNKPATGWEKQYGGGDPRSVSIEDIWSSEGFERFRDDLMNPSSTSTIYNSKCRKCGYFEKQCTPCLIAQSHCHDFAGKISKLVREEKQTGARVPLPVTSRKILLPVLD